MTQEQWKPVVGYEGYYEVSSLGRVKRLAVPITRSDGRKTRSRSGILRPSHPGRDGRPRVNLYKEGEKRAIYVARLVAEAFVPNLAGKPFVLHWDDNPKNNTPENLHWGTHQENMAEMVERNRHVSVNRTKTHCPRGHEYTDENTFVSRGSRNCRECTRVRNRKWWSENRAKESVDRDPESTVTQFVNETGRLPSQANPAPEPALYLRFYKAIKRGEEWALTLKKEYS